MNKYSVIFKMNSKYPNKVNLSINYLHKNYELGKFL